MTDSARSNRALSLIHTSDCDRTAHRGQLRLRTVNGGEANSTAASPDAGFENPGSAASPPPRRTFLSTFGRLIKPSTPDAKDVIVDADFWDHRHRS